MTDYLKGVQFGGSNGFDIQQGGNIINSFDTVSGTTFNEGGVVELTSAAALQQSTDQNTRLTGLTNTRKSTDFLNNQTQGDGKAGIVMDAAVVTTVELTSGAVFTPNSKVYNGGAGKWHSTVGSTDTRVYGQALNSAVANNGDTLLFFYRGAQLPA